MGVSKNKGTPKWMVYKENPIKMDDLGVPLFSETSIYIYISSFLLWWGFTRYLQNFKGRNSYPAWWIWTEVCHEWCGSNSRWVANKVSAGPLPRSCSWYWIISFGFVGSWAGRGRKNVMMYFSYESVVNRMLANGWVWWNLPKRRFLSDFNAWLLTSIESAEAP